MAPPSVLGASGAGGGLQRRPPADVEALAVPVRARLKAATARAAAASAALKTAQREMEAAEAELAEASAAERSVAGALAKLGGKHQRHADEIECELLLRLVHRRPELHRLLGASSEAVAQALTAHREEVIQVVDELVRRRRAEAERPADPEQLKEHHRALLERSQAGHSITIPADRSSRAAAATSATSEAYATLASDGRLRVLSLVGLRTSPSPRAGAILGGVIAAPAFQFHDANSRSGGGGGDEQQRAVQPTRLCVSSLLISDDGTLVRLRIYGCPSADADSIGTPGTRLCILHPWLLLAGDGWPTIRVDDAATIHYGLRPRQLLDAIGKLLVRDMDAETDQRDLVRPALAAKEAGSAAFKRGGYHVALQEYSKGLALLLFEGDVPLDRYGFAALREEAVTTPEDDMGLTPPPPPLLRTATAEVLPLVVALLSNRAAAALKLGLYWRALADTVAAASLTPATPKLCFRRAQALLSLGAYSRAVVVLEPHTATEPELRTLYAQAHRSAAAIEAGVTGARVGSAAAAAAAATRAGVGKAGHGGSTARATAFIGPLALRWCSQRRSVGRRGWVAMEAVEDGGLLLVEPAAALASSNAAEDASRGAAVAATGGAGGFDRKGRDEADAEALLSLVAATIRDGGGESWRLHEALECIQHLGASADEFDERNADQEADEIEQLTRALARGHPADGDGSSSFAASAAAESHSESARLSVLVRRDSHSLSRLCAGESVPCGHGLFPLSGACLHSCSPNASATFDHTAGVLITRATRPIEPGEQICVSLLDLTSGFVGWKRRERLASSYSLDCSCACCGAPPGSQLFSRERLMMSLVCTEASRRDHHNHGHALLPIDPYAQHSEFTCAVPGCKAVLSATAAAAQLKKVHAAFEALRAPFETGAFQQGCHSARHALRTAKAVLSPTHHEWALWVAAASALASGANDTELLLTAKAVRMAMDGPDCRFGEEDVRLHIQCAVALELSGQDATDALEKALELDVAASNCDAELFSERWVPAPAVRLRQAVRMVCNGEALAPAQRQESAQAGGQDAPSATEQATQDGARTAAAAAATTAAAAKEVKRLKTLEKAFSRRAGKEGHMIKCEAERSAHDKDEAGRKAMSILSKWRVSRGGGSVDEDDEDEDGFAYAGFGAGEAEQEHAAAQLEQVWLLDSVLSDGECDTVRRAVDMAAARRGGWDRDRHGKYPTTDMPLSEAPEVEALVRSAVFRRVLRPLTPLYLPEGFVPEHLELRDCFYVKYSASPGQQRDLQVHTDGSIFSFNVLLNDPADFDGGGTFFEPTRTTVRASKGSAVGHSGQVRHGGVEITRGERYLLVGFVGCATYPYAPRCPPPGIKGGDSDRALPGWAQVAERDAFIKFGEGAWDRTPTVVPRAATGDASEEPRAVSTAAARAEESDDDDDSSDGDAIDVN
jgi:tetratricopeptide (TPR) repeat protein